MVNKYLQLKCKLTLKKKIYIAAKYCIYYAIRVPNSKKKACILLCVTSLQVLILPLNSEKWLQIFTGAEKSNAEESGFWWLVNFTIAAFISLSEYSKMKIYWLYYFISTRLGFKWKDKIVWSCFYLAKQSWHVRNSWYPFSDCCMLDLNPKLIISLISALAHIQVLLVLM